MDSESVLYFDNQKKIYEFPFLTSKTIHADAIITEKVSQTIQTQPESSQKKNFVSYTKSISFRAFIFQLYLTFYCTPNIWKREERKIYLTVVTLA